MDSLSKIAQGIFIGNGEVWNFLDYAVNRNCGGLLTYTQKKNYLSGNLFSNFNHGILRRNYYSEITYTDSFGVSELTDQLRVSDVHARGGDIGELYSVPEASNSKLNFISKRKFTEFEGNIRKRMLGNNERHRRLSGGTYDYTDIHPSAKQKLYVVDFDQDIDSSTHLIKEGNLDDEYTVGFSYKNRWFTIDEVAEKFHNFSKLKNNVYQNAFVEKTFDFEKYYTNNEKTSDGRSDSEITKNIDTIFSNTVDTSKVIHPLYFSGSGIYDFYNRLRDTYKSKFNGVDYPKDETMYKGVHWGPSLAYGIDEKSETFSNYVVGEKNTFNGDVNVSSNFKGGEQTLFNDKNNTRTYKYFQEQDASGSVPESINSEYTVSDGSAVMLSDYSGSSRLLKKTNKMFRDGKIKSLINRFHSESIGDDSEMITSFDPHFGLSRGRNLIRQQYEGKQSGDKKSGYDNPYCRVWTAHYQYSKLKDRIRPFLDEDGRTLSIADTQSNYGELRPRGGANSLSTNSVLREDGFLRITPTYGESGDYSGIQKYMFSLENLAWKDVNVDGNKSLSKEQKGPKGGRIMWFPPYNLRFSENVNVNWNANTFIGRGEEIYTYTNTVRTGTLDFTLLIDHPSIINKWRGTSADIEDKEKMERDILRYFAGCGNINDDVKPKKNGDAKNDPKEDTPTTTPEPKFSTKKIAYVVFFPNNFSASDYINKRNYDKAIDILSSYNSGGEETVSDKSYENQVLKPWNETSKGLTPSSHEVLIRQQLFGGDENIEIKYFSDLLSVEENFTGDKIFGFDKTTCEISGVETMGFASNHGRYQYNMQLCERRRKFIEEVLQYKSNSLGKDIVPYTSKDGREISVPDIDNKADINTIDAKIARAAYAIISVKWREDNVAGSNVVGDGTEEVVTSLNLDGVKINESEEDTNTSRIVEYNSIDESEYKYDNEYLYFSEIRGDSLEYKHIVDKVRYFNPAFHSITPEGFNSRLTFLHQCTRQGPTNAVSGGGVNKDSNDYLKFAGNLAFGRAPYCILRIGDFFNTKICIDSLSITYDNNGVQWDLNPEGVGVQPMFANISINFKFIGGQDISGPVERLQNAVTSNYYANASVYSRHADNATHFYDAIQDKETTLVNNK